MISERARRVPLPRPRRLTGTRRRSADPGCPEAVARVLIDYLKDHLGVRDLDYVAEPSPITNGWETHIYAFQIRGRRLPRAWSRALMLRIHPSRQGVRWARREFEVPRYLVRLRYPVPRTLLLEETCGLFGGPFLVMEEVPGCHLLQAMLQQPLHPLRFPALMAKTHARLHALATEGFPARAGQFLDRELGAIRAAIRRYGLKGLQPGLDWLASHRPAASPAPSILHLDFHPLNLIVRRDDSLAVIDWTYADLGDPHADVATTLLLLECGPVPVTGPWDRLVAAIGRPLIARWYLHSYRRLRPLEDDRLAYYRAWSAVRHLVRFGSSLHAGPEAFGRKTSLVKHLSPDLLTALGGYVRRWAGVEVSL